MPILTRVLGTVLLGHDGLALLVIANGSALVFAALLHRIAWLETGDARLAQRAAWFGAVFPPFSALVLGYADATAMALAAGMFLALRTRRYRLGDPPRPARRRAAVRSGCCSSRRPLFEAAHGWWSATGRDRARRVGAVLAPAVGLAAFLAYSGVAFGDAFEPLTIQNQAKLRGRFQFPVTSVWARHPRPRRTPAGSVPACTSSGRPASCCCSSSCGDDFPARTPRTPPSRCCSRLSAQNLDSFERYCASTLPFLLAVAIITARPKIERAAARARRRGACSPTRVLIFLGSTCPEPPDLHAARRVGWGIP